MTPSHPQDIFKARLYKRFMALVQRTISNCPDRDIKRAWQTLCEHYDEPHRLYHTLVHIDYCLSEFDKAKFLLRNSDAVEMAIWYHDIIHTPKSRDNEYQSSVFFRQFAETYIDSDFTDIVTKLILITTHRDTPQNHDELFICDIDLSSMGASWNRFIEDSNHLRAESESSIEEYTLGKLKFFNALLERPRVFYTDFFYARYENSARQNINRYMRMLNQEG